MRTPFFVNLATLMLATFATLHAADPPGPNRLFIYTDDQSCDALSIVQKEHGEKGRFPWLQTPNLDRLAAEGVRIRNVFVINSLCSPSRAVNPAGLYNPEGANGIASNLRAFPVNNVTRATLLCGAGYTTADAGKWHVGAPTATSRSSTCPASTTTPANPGKPRRGCAK